MDRVTFPERVAGELVLPDGTRVWVQTVNRLQREEAREDATVIC